MVIISFEALKYSKKTLSQYHFVGQNTKRTALESSLVTVAAEFEFILEDLRIRRLIRWVHYVINLENLYFIEDV
jgi:hypothetical protein